MTGLEMLLPVEVGELVPPELHVLYLYERNEEEVSS